MKPAFLQQLVDYEQRLKSQLDVPLSDTWDSVEGLDFEELMLRNTYLNLQRDPLAEIQLPLGQGRSHSKNVSWDVVIDRENIPHCGRDHMGNPILKSLLKGGQRAKE